MPNHKAHVHRRRNPVDGEPEWIVTMPCPKGCPDALEVILRLGDDVGAAVFYMDGMMDAHCKEQHDKPYIIRP